MLRSRVSQKRKEEEIVSSQYNNKKAGIFAHSLMHLMLFVVMILTILFFYQKREDEILINKLIDTSVEREKLLSLITNSELISQKEVVQLQEFLKKNTFTDPSVTKTIAQNIRDKSSADLERTIHDRVISSLNTDFNSTDSDVVVDIKSESNIYSPYLDDLDQEFDKKIVFNFLGEGDFRQQRRRFRSDMDKSKDLASLAPRNQELPTINQKVIRNPVKKTPSSNRRKVFNIPAAKKSKNVNDKKRNRIFSKDLSKDKDALKDFKDGNKKTKEAVKREDFIGDEVNRAQPENKKIKGNKDIAENKQNPVNLKVQGDSKALGRPNLPKTNLLARGRGNDADETPNVRINKANKSKGVDQNNPGSIISSDDIANPSKDNKFAAKEDDVFTKDNQGKEKDKEKQNKKGKNDIGEDKRKDGEVTKGEDRKGGDKKHVVMNKPLNPTTDRNVSNVPDIGRAKNNPIKSLDNPGNDNISKHVNIPGSNTEGVKIAKTIPKDDVAGKSSIGADKSSIGKETKGKDSHIPGKDMVEDNAFRPNTEQPQRVDSQPTNQQPNQVSSTQPLQPNNSARDNRAIPTESNSSKTNPTRLAHYSNPQRTGNPQRNNFAIKASPSEKTTNNPKLATITKPQVRKNTSKIATGRDTTPSSNYNYRYQHMPNNKGNNSFTVLPNKIANNTDTKKQPVNKNRVTNRNNRNKTTESRPSRSHYSSFKSASPSASNKVKPAKNNYNNQVATLSPYITRSWTEDENYPKSHRSATVLDNKDTNNTNNNIQNNRNYNTSDSGINSSNSSRYTTPRGRNAVTPSYTNNTSDSGKSFLAKIISRSPLAYLLPDNNSLQIKPPAPGFMNMFKTLFGYKPKPQPKSGALYVYKHNSLPSALQDNYGNRNIIGGPPFYELPNYVVAFNKMPKNNIRERIITNDNSKLALLDNFIEETNPKKTKPKNHNKLFGNNQFVAQKTDSKPKIENLSSGGDNDNINIPSPSKTLARIEKYSTDNQRVSLPKQSSNDKHFALDPKSLPKVNNRSKEPKQNTAANYDTRDDYRREKLLAGDRFNYNPRLDNSAQDKNKILNNKLSLLEDMASTSSKLTPEKKKLIKEVQQLRKEIGSSGSLCK